MTLIDLPKYVLASIGRVSANTTLAACATGLTAMMYAYFPSKKWDIGFTVNCGFGAGLQMNFTSPASRL